MEHRQIAFEEILKKKGLKATPQRIALLKIISEHGHVDVEFIYKQVKEIIPTISISTVYNNIKSLEKAGVIKEVCISSFNKTLYETNTREHVHIVCANCNKILDFYCDIDKLMEEFKSMIKNDILSFELTLFSICDECKGK